MVSVALAAIVIGLLAGFGLGYRLGSATPRPAATVSPATTPPPDVEADRVSSRLQAAFESAAPGGWAVCALERDVLCRAVTAGPTDPRVPPSEYGQGWYGNLALTRVSVSRSHLVLAAAIGEGSVAAYLNHMGPGDAFLQVVEITPVSPGRRGTFYFDLGTLAPGHYVVQLDFMAVPPSESAGEVEFYMAGFVVS